MCTPHQTNLRLPMHAVERRPDAAPLAATEILFMVMGSHRYRQRSLRAHRTWCTRPQKLSCIFFSDEREGEKKMHDSFCGRVHQVRCIFFSDEREGEAADTSGVPLVQVLG